MRHTRSPLSARSMSRIRAPSRTDFLRSIPFQSSPDAIETPTKHNRRILDALDKLEDSSLSAIATWLESLREYPRLSDKDFWNGVALRNAMYIADPTVGPPREDLGDDASDENLRAVRSGLEKFEWGVEIGDDAWEMARWVVLAAVSGERSDDILKGMMELEDNVQDVLSGVVRDVMEEAGIGDDAMVKVERERRLRAEAEVERLREEIECLKGECDRLQRIVEERDLERLEDRISVLTERS